MLIKNQILTIKEQFKMSLLEISFLGNGVQISKEHDSANLKK